MDQTLQVARKKVLEKGVEKVKGNLQVPYKVQFGFQRPSKKDIIYKRASAMQEVQMNCKFMTDVHGKNETFLQELHENWSQNFTTLFKCIENKLG